MHRLFNRYIIRLITIFSMVSMPSSAYGSSQYKSLNDYIAASSTKKSQDGNSIEINPYITSIKKVYIDLKKSTTSDYSYIHIYNEKETNRIELSSKYLQSTSNTNLYYESKPYNIKTLADNGTYGWIYYNPNNHDELIIDVEQYFCGYGHIRGWQKNFGTSCVVNIITEDFQDPKDMPIAEPIDLGLSVKWASWNMGASKIADYGGLYGAGDPTGQKTSTNPSDYYFKDGESICGTEYDLAHVKWGEPWRMPTFEELLELSDKCTWEHNVTIDGVKGSIATGPNGNSIFIPYAGSINKSGLHDNDYRGSLFSGDMGTSKYESGYQDLDILSTGRFQTDGCPNWCHQSIRPVHSGNTSAKRTIHVAGAGTLPDLISESEKYNIEELTLTGELNGTDFRLLRDMAGCNYLGEKTAGILRALDLSGAKVVAGGEKYVDTDHLPGWGGDYHYSIDKNDILPQFVFNGCPLISFVVPNSVTSIEGAAFCGCSGLTSITIPNSVTSIGDDAFNQCSGLTTIKVESGNEKYDSRNGCNAIIETASNTLIVGCKNSTIPNSVTNIGKNAFCGCCFLTLITIPSSVTRIGDNAFMGCSGLTTITIPNSVTSIGRSAFAWCSGLTSIISEIQNPIEIDVNVFFSYTNATLTVPSGTKAKYQQTNYWNKFTNIVEASSTSSGEWKDVTSSFDKSIAFTKIRVQNKKTSSGTYCCVFFSTEPNDETTKDTKYNINFNRLTIGDGVEQDDSKGYIYINTCKLIDDNWYEYEFKQPVYFSHYQSSAPTNLLKAFVGGTDQETSTKRTIHVATAGTLPNLFSESEKYNIEELTLTGELNGTDFRLLRDMAGCNYLGEVTAGKLTVLDMSGAKVVAGGEKYVDTNSLPGWSGSFRYSIDKNDILPQHVFHGCKLISIVIPNSVTSIGSAAFCRCSCLTSMAIPNSVTSIGSDAFQDCSGLTSLTIPNSVTSIGSGAFRDCSGLTSLTIPNSVTSIGSGAFWGCSDLTSIKVESGNAKYDSRNGCNAIIETATNTLIVGCKNTAIPNSVTSIGSSAFYGCSGLTSLTIPNSVTSIGHGAFDYCSSLTSLTIPNSVMSIGGYAFSGCSGLTSLTIPNSVTSIERGAFAYCSGLTSIISEIQNPFEIDENVFSSSYTKATLTVPSGTKSKYLQTDYWNKFTIIVETSGSNEANLLTYGDFETWSGGQPTGWKSTSTASSATLAQSTDAHGGSYSVNVNGKESSNVRLASQEITLSAGTYVFSFYAKATTADAVQTRPGYVPVTDGKVGSYAYGNYENLNNSSWTLVTHEFTLDAETTVCLVVMNPKKSDYSSGKDILIDDASLTTNNGGLADKSEKVRTIHVATAGTLPDLISESEKYNIEELTLTGELNGTDFRLLRDMAGCNYFGEETAGKLKVLDLSSAKVVAGGEKYVDPSSFPGWGEEFSYSIDKNDILPRHIFQDCKLISFVIPNSVTSIGYFAFCNCNGLTSLSIPNSVTSIEPWAFNRCSGLTTIKVESGNTKYDSRNGCNAIIETATNTLITGCNNTTIPNSVTSIGGSAFSGRSGLTSITIPNSVTSIGGSAFEGCSALTSITIPNSITSIGDGTFYQCSALTSITIPNSVTSIGSSAFYGCRSLTSITIPKSVTSIRGGWIFEGCI